MYRGKSAGLVSKGNNSVNKLALSMKIKPAVIANLLYQSGNINNKGASCKTIFKMSRADI